MTDEPTICRDCGTHVAAGALPGSGWIEVVLWLAWLVPGLIYSIWRRGGRKRCPACGSAALVPASSPVGQQLSDQHPPRSPAPRAPGAASAGHGLGRAAKIAGVALLGLFLGLIVVGKLTGY